MTDDNDTKEQGTESLDKFKYGIHDGEKYVGYGDTVNEAIEDARRNGHRGITDKSIHEGAPWNIETLRDD